VTPTPRQRHARAPAPESGAGGRVRLQKFLSDAGVASRRHAEELILDGRVLINDQVVDSLPAFVDPEHDRVVVNGTRVRPRRPDYFMVHKPKGVVCTNTDPAGRTRAVDLLPDLPARLFPVGRLDAETSGLLLMTNDGELAQLLTHPRYGVPKTYEAEIRGRAPADLPARLKTGVFLSEGKALADEVEILHAGQDRSMLRITLRERRNRQIRRMLVRLGHPVRKLKRTQIGPLLLHGLPVGSARRLTAGELAALRAAAANAAAAAERPPRRRKPKSTTAPSAARGQRGTPRRPEPPAGPSRRLIT